MTPDLWTVLFVYVCTYLHDFNHNVKAHPNHPCVIKFKELYYVGQEHKIFWKKFILDKGLFQEYDLWKLPEPKRIGANLR
jgi:hypothetical protein